jgi:sec-independent protein translocase protein TatA
VPNLGVSELLVIFLMLLLVFGGSRLPQLGESLGRTLRNFKRGIASDDRIQADPDKAASADPSKPTGKDSLPQSTGTALKRDATDAELIDKS